MKRTTAFAVAAVAGLAAVASAQDSVSINGSAAAGSDALDAFSVINQRVNYVVDLTPFSSTWGTSFAIAPLVKSSKIDPTFENALIRAQSISRGITDGTPANSYLFWTTAGEGVHVGDNLNPGAQNAPASGALSFTGNDPRQFALGFHEVGGAALDAESLVTAIVNLDEQEPTRLYVERIVAATSGVSQFLGNDLLNGFGYGSVDSNGNTAVKEGGFGQTGPQSTILIDAENRDGSVINNLDTLFSFPSSAGDAAVTSFPIDQLIVDANIQDTISASNLIAESVGGPTVVNTQFGGFGGTFDTQYINGSNRQDLNVPGGLGTRGSFATQVYPVVPGVGGDASIAILTKDTVVDETRAITFWNVDGSGVRQPAGNPTPLYIEFPANVQDNKYPRTGGFDVFFEHYRSQVGAQGGTGQVTYGLDQQDNLIAAAYAAALPGGGNDIESAIVAVRRDAAGNEDFGLVAWTGPQVGLFNALGSRGKPVVDAAGGNTIGFIANMQTFTFEFGGLVNDSLSDGPSFSAPSIDAAGNIWFLAPVELLDAPVTDPAQAPALIPGDADIEIGLVRAVYDANAALPSWDLELVLRTGDEFTGQNSATDYRVGIAFFQIADANGVSTSTFWSHNAISAPFAGRDNAAYDTADPRNSGGVVVSAEIIYDLGPTPGADPDPVFDFNAGDVNVPDEAYQAMLYVGSGIGIETDVCVNCPDLDGDNFVGTSDLLVLLGNWNAAVANGESGDADCDGFVGTSDLLLLLAAWNSSPGC
jgi:hypothetical protein